MNEESVFKLVVRSPRVEVSFCALYLAGFQSGLAYQECPLSWAVFNIPHQTLLYLQYSHHLAECSGLEPLCHFTSEYYGTLLADAYVLHHFRCWHPGLQETFW